MRITDYMRSHFLTAWVAARCLVEKRFGMILNLTGGMIVQ
jgi:hypothetical protein